jgi:hypothetical protein
VDVHGIFPAVVFVAIAFPLDEVLKSSSRYMAVKYGFNFIMFLSINQDRIWRGITPSSWNQICRCRHQFDHWKDRV